MLINEYPSPCLRSLGDLGKDSLYHSSLFLLITEGIIRLIIEEKRDGTLKGIKVTSNINLFHLLFVDGITLFGEGTIRGNAEHV